MQVDATVLQYQNQKLLQQIDIQKQELHDIEARIKELKDKQSSYDDILIVVNQLWNQVSLMFNSHKPWIHSKQWYSHLLLHVIQNFFKTQHSDTIAKWRKYHIKSYLIQFFLEYMASFMNG